MKKILVVEDERILSQAYRTVLASSGFEVKTAANGEIALRVLDKFQPDLILLDIFMPRVDGVEFMRHWVKRPPNATKILVFSNSDAVEQIKQALELGAHGSALKSHYTPRELVELVESYLKS